MNHYATALSATHSPPSGRDQYLFRITRCLFFLFWICSEVRYHGKILYMWFQIWFTSIEKYFHEFFSCFFHIFRFFTTYQPSQSIITDIFIQFQLSKCSRSSSKLNVLQFLTLCTSNQFWIKRTFFTERKLSASSITFSKECKRWYLL